MTRLALLMGLFLSVTVSSLVFLLSMLARVPLGTVLFRSLIVFFGFGLLGAIFGSLLEILLMTSTTDIEKKKLQKELVLADSTIERDLGDLLHPSPPKKERKPSLPPDDAPAGMIDPVGVPGLAADSYAVRPGGDSAVVS